MLQASAEAHGVYPSYVGVGQDASWGPGLGAKINGYRRFVFSQVADQDIVVLADAWDVLFYGGLDEIREKFLQLELATGRSLVFNAEEQCIPPVSAICQLPPGDVLDAPGFAGRRYLNAGLMAGRGWAMKRMLAEPVPNIMAQREQVWYQNYYLANPGEITLDVNCTLLCVEGTPTSTLTWLSAERRLAAGDVRPSVVHFPGHGHYSAFNAQGVMSSRIIEAFREAHPREASNLLSLDSWHVELRAGRLAIVDYKGAGPWSALRAVHCVTCSSQRLLRNHEHFVCQELRAGGECQQAAAVGAALGVVVLSAAALCLSGSTLRLRRPTAK